MWICVQVCGAELSLPGHQQRVRAVSQLGCQLVSSHVQLPGVARNG